MTSTSIGSGEPSGFFILIPHLAPYLRQAGSDLDLEFDQLRSRLQWSLSVLSDMLPDHIVRMIMRQHQGEEEEEEEADTGGAAAGNEELQGSDFGNPGDNPVQALFQELQTLPPEALPEARLLTLLEVNRAAMAVPFITPPCILPATCLEEEVVITEAKNSDSRRSVISCNSTSSSDIISPSLGADLLGPAAIAGSNGQPNIGFFTRLTSKVVKSLNRTMSGSLKESPPPPVAHDGSSSGPSRDRSSQHGVLSRAPSGGAVDLSPTHSAPSRTISRRSSFISGPAAGPSPSSRGQRRSSVSNFTAAESHDCVTIFFSDLCGFST